MTREEAIKVVKSATVYTPKEIEALETLIPGFTQSEDDRILNALITHISIYEGDFTTVGVTRMEILDYLERLKKQKPSMIQWKGDNLKEVIDFTGKSPMFNKWFKSFEEYEEYVHSHGNIFKMFNEDGSHYEVPVGAWIVKTPDGCNVPSKAVFRQKPTECIPDSVKFEEGFKTGKELGFREGVKSVKLAEWSDTNELVFKDICKHLKEEGYNGWIVLLNALRNGEFQPKQEQNDYITPHKEFFKFIYDRLINVHKENPNVDYMRSFKERLDNLSFEEKQEWSEEDKERIQRIHDFMWKNRKGDTDTIYHIEKDADWLLSLLPQPKREYDNYCKESCKGYQETGKCFSDGPCAAKQG